MNNLKIILSFIVIACIVTSCEKDDVLNTNSNESFVKNKSINNKDGDEQTTEEIAFYIRNLMEGETPVDQTIKNALLNVEAALNWTMTDFDTELEYVTFDTVSAIINLDPSNSQNILGDDALSLFDNLQSDISSLYSSTVLPGSGDKFINVIDIVYEEDAVYTSGSALVVHVGVARSGGSATPCLADGGYYIFTKGVCGADPGSNPSWNASDAITARIGTRGCDNNIAICNGDGSDPDIPTFFWDIETVVAAGSQLTKNSPTYCVSETEQANIIGNIRAFQDANFPQVQGPNSLHWLYLIDAGTYTNAKSDHSTPPNFTYEIKYYYRTAKCGVAVAAMLS